MSFAAFCLCHAFDAQRRLEALVEVIMRRRLAREAEATRARLWATVAGEED